MSQDVILVVEDDGAQRRALQRLLSDHFVKCVCNAEQAVDLLLGGEPLVAAIIDIGLPGFSGLELLIRIRPARPTLPVIVLSGHTNPAYINAAGRLGAQYLCKPVTQADLRGALSHMRSQIDTSCAGRSGHQSTTMIIERYGLSKRESEILTMSLQGLRRDVIRLRLGISESTVKKTVARLLRKCNAASLRELEERFSGSNGLRE